MGKAVLISIRPEWVEKIMSGEKTLEVRKTRPNMGTPFKCYIYCTLGRGNAFGEVFGGLVVGEFMCDRIKSVFGSAYLKMPESAFAGSCLNMYQIDTYLDGKDGHFWHISDLKIYAQPKQLSEFKGRCNIKMGCWECPYYNYTTVECDGRTIKRPPQSWCYVEELK